MNMHTKSNSVVDCKNVGNNKILAPGIDKRIYFNCKNVL